MRNETFYVIVDDETLEFQMENGEGTSEIIDAVKFDELSEARAYVREALCEDFQEHCLIYKVKMHYYLERE